MLQCQHCGATVRPEEPMPRDAECPGCGRDLRACRQCGHYDTAFNHSCRETEADPVAEKDRRNFCEFFSFTRAGFQAGAGEAARQSAARAKLEALFGGTQGAPSTAGEARSKLDALFKKKEPDG